MNDQPKPTPENAATPETPETPQTQAPQTPESTPTVSDAEKAAAEAEANKQVDAAMAAAEDNKATLPKPMTGEAGEASSTPEKPKDQAPEEAAPTVSEAASRDAEAAMAAAAAPAAGSGSGKKPAIRGPRVVEGGREHRSGNVVSIGSDDIFIEFGPKELGVLPKAQLKESEEAPKVGDSLEVVVDRFDAGESVYVCSLPGAVQKAEWELLEKGQVVEAKVTGKNKGGLELEVANHRAFMPASQVDVHRIEDLSIFIGQKLTCKVTKIERGGRGNITLSRRDIVAEERADQAKKLRESLKEGDVIEGTVRKIMPFGAFVDMGGIDGLLHVSDLSHDRASKVEDFVKEGQQVKVKILKLDWENDRHGLGLKQLEPDPWDEKLAEVVEGEIVTGRITKLLEFGCFVEVADGIEGLVHISELAWKRVEKTSDIVQPNNTVKVKVLSVDKDKRKISLSIKQASDRPEQKGGGGRGGPGGRGGRGRRGEQEKDTRTPDEILKETPKLRRMREQSKRQENKKQDTGGGLSGVDYLGGGLGDLKL